MIIYMATVKIDDKTLERLRAYLALVHKGKMYGTITTELNKAVNEHLDRMEKKKEK